MELDEGSRSKLDRIFVFHSFSYSIVFFSSYYLRRFLRIDDIDVNAGGELQSAKVGHIGQYFRMPVMVWMPVPAERRVVDEKVEIGVADAFSNRSRTYCIISATPRITGGGVSSNFGKCFFGITLTSKGRFEA